MQADVFMAVLAAVFVDSGGNSLEAVQKVYAVSIGGKKLEGAMNINEIRLQNLVYEEIEVCFNYTDGMTRTF